MGFLDDLRNSRDSEINIYNKFIRDYPRKPGYIFSFFEGRDDVKFYTGFIRYIFKKDNIIAYICDGKKDVYEIYERISKRNENNIKLFFVDKDLSDFLNEKHTDKANIFVTDYYSFENYLVSPFVLRRILREIFEKDIINFDESILIDKFNKELNKFYDTMKNVIAWYICVKRNGFKAIIKNINMSDLFEFDNDINIITRINGNINDFMSNLCKINCVGEFLSDIENIQNELSNFDPKKYIPGKLELQFFIDFIIRLEISINKEVLSSTKGAGKVNKGNAMETLALRTPIPSSLELFLQRNVSNDI